MPLPTRSNKPEAKQGYYTWETNQDLANIFNKIIDNTQEMSVYRDYGTYYDHENVVPNVSVRQGLRRKDYESFRPDESIPTEPMDIMQKCDQTYYECSLIRNLVDVMSEFTVRGINISHPNKKVQKVLRAWWKQIQGVERSERFVNMLVRLGNIIVQRITAVLEEESLNNTLGTLHGADFNKLPNYDKLKVGELPWKYIFIAPYLTEVVNPESGHLTDRYTFSIKVSDMVSQKLKYGMYHNRGWVNKIPDYILKNVNNGKSEYILPKERTKLYTYKRDDWNLFSVPIIYSVLPDVFSYQKMKLADIAALDGVISNIRMWKLGDLDNKIIPGPEIFQKLQNIIMTNSGGGTVDILWTPDIELIQTATEAYKFLGDEKYKPFRNAIYEGMGMTPSVGGGLNDQGSFNSAFFSLKILLERLTFIREVLNNFWETELKIVQESLGLKQPGIITYTFMNLVDEAAEKRLLVEMSDRFLISDESLRERSDLNHDLETQRLRREYRKKESRIDPPKAGPWFQPEYLKEYKKLMVQQQIVTPSQVGVKLPKKLSSEGTPMGLKMPKAPAGSPGVSKTSAPKLPNSGRPPGSKDKTQRTRRPTIRASLDENLVISWAKSVQQEIANIVNPLYLEFFEKDNLRRLTELEAKELEDIKFSILCNLEPFSTIDNELIGELVGSILDDSVFEYRDLLVAKFKEKIKNNPTLDSIKDIQSMVYYNLYYGEANA